MKYEIHAENGSVTFLGERRGKEFDITYIENQGSLGHVGITLEGMTISYVLSLIREFKSIRFSSESVDKFIYENFSRYLVYDL